MAENKTDVSSNSCGNGMVGKFNGIPVFLNRNSSYEKLDKVIAAYEWCWNEEKHEQDCSRCPYVDTPEGCNKQVDMDTLDLLKEFRELLVFGFEYGYIKFGDCDSDEIDEWS